MVSSSVKDDACVDEIADLPGGAFNPLLSYAEQSREYRRTVYMHPEWVKHRSANRFIRNIRTIGESGVGQSLGKELSFITATAIFVVLINMILYQYQGFGGEVHPGILSLFSKNLGAIALPAFPFSILMPALSLLITFRCNTGYSRWNEARTLWGGVVNNCRNIVRQANLYFADDVQGRALKDNIAANTAAFAKALRNFLRGPSDDDTFRRELLELVAAGHIPIEQVDECMAAKNRPMFMLNAMTDSLRRANLDPINRARIDQSITTLVDLTGACERIFKSPVPLVYTRHTSRFLVIFLTLLPFAMWSALDKSWNHWATVPATDVVAFFLLGIEEIGVQVEEPFSILPLEALCNGAIAAAMEEMVEQTNMRTPVSEVQMPSPPQSQGAFAPQPAHYDDAPQPAYYNEAPQNAGPSQMSSEDEARKRYYEKRMRGRR
jgi:predicted membrane chloride channel (bestrophin family)